MAEPIVDNILNVTNDSIPHVVAEVVSDSTLHNINSLMETTANNTAFGWLPSGIDLTIAGVALLFSIITWIAQKRTERNTSRMSLKEQKLLMTDMIRHFYRNLVVCYTMKVKMEKEGFAMYPSEEHLLKLKVNLEDIHLNLFYKNNAQHNLMNDLYVKLRNYNIEIDVICEHFKKASPEYNDDRDQHELKKRDLDTLIFKSSFLTQQIVETIGTIWYKKKTWRRWFLYLLLFRKSKIEEMKKITVDALNEKEKKNAIQGKNKKEIEKKDLTTKQIIEENYKEAYYDVARERIETAQKNNVKQNKDKRLHYKEDFIKFQTYLKETDPERDSFHAQKLYKKEKDKEAFFERINNDIKIECGNNTNGSTKIYMIPIS